MQRERLSTRWTSKRKLVPPILYRPLHPFCLLPACLSRHWTLESWLPNFAPVSPILLLFSPNGRNVSSNLRIFLSGQVASFLFSLFHPVRHTLEPYTPFVLLDASDAPRFTISLQPPPPSFPLIIDLLSHFILLPFSSSFGDCRNQSLQPLPFTSLSFSPFQFDIIKLDFEIEYVRRRIPTLFRCS